MPKKTNSKKPSPKPETAEEIPKEKKTNPRKTTTMDLEYSKWLIAFQYGDEINPLDILFTKNEQVLKAIYPEIDLDSFHDLISELNNGRIESLEEPTATIMGGYLLNMIDLMTEQDKNKSKDNKSKFSAIETALNGIYTLINRDDIKDMREFLVIFPHFVGARNIPDVYDQYNKVLSNLKANLNKLENLKPI